MQRGEFPVGRLSSECSLIGAIGALVILAVGALLLFEVAAFDQRHPLDVSAIPPVAPAAETAIVTWPAFGADLADADAVFRVRYR
jgi:hypothetical protein